MFAVIETGGKQYKVSPGNTIRVEKLGEYPIEETKTQKEDIVINKVLLVKNQDGNLLIGKPFLNNVEVYFELEETFKDDKVIDFTKRRRKNSRRKNGHRQTLTKLKVLKIVVK